MPTATRKSSRKKVGRKNPGRKGASTARTAKKSDKTAQQLAALCAEARAELNLVGRGLHDEVGPLLSVAGMLLDQAQGDFPKASDSLKEVQQRISEAMERVRALSQQATPTPAIRIGLKRALTELAAQGRGIGVRFTDSSPTQLPGPVVAAMYSATVAAVSAAVQCRAANIQISVAFGARITIQVADDGRSAMAVATREQLLEPASLLARASKIRVKIVTAKEKAERSTRKAPAHGTIVSIQYAI